MKESIFRRNKKNAKISFADHCGYVRNQTLDKATGEHFSLPGHSVSDLTITVIEQSKRNNNLYRKEREEYNINRFNTFYKGLNKRRISGVGLLYIVCIMVNKFISLIITTSVTTVIFITIAI